MAHQLEEADKAASGTFLNEDGELVTILSKNEMEEAYELGVQYAAAGNYEEAIVELEKVTEKSRLYKDAQEALAQTRENYKNDLIGKAQENGSKGDYETALNILDTGVAALGDNEDFTNTHEEILNALKADYVGKAEASENEEAYNDAILALQTALTFIPNDEELTGKITVLTAINAAETALKNAEKYKANEDYVSLFATLDAVKKDVEASTTASSKIKLAYDSYKKEYLSSVKLLANTATTISEYDAAVSALTTAISIFSDDSELITLQKDMSNMRTATKALNEADAYIGMKDYKNAFTVLANAQDTLPVGTVAYTKVKAQYDNTKTTFLNYIDEVTNNPQSIAEYDEAISALDAASEIFPYESNLSAKKTTLTNMRTAKKAVEEADAYAAKEDYKNLFSTLQNAIDALSGASDARKVAETAYNKYESSYLEALASKVGEPKTVNEYDSAISLLKSASIVFPNNIDIQNKLKTYEQECPVSLFSRPLMSASRKYESGKVEAPEHSFQLNSENVVDNINNQYETAALISDGWGAFKDYFTTEAVFDCDGYNKLSGTVAISNDYKDAGGTHHLIIYGSGDGEKYTKLAGKDFTSGMRPWSFEDVDISKYSNLKIALKTDDGVAVSRLILADFTLWK